MRRDTALAGIAIVVLLATACTAGTGTTSAPSSINPSASHAPVTLTLWSFYTNPEFDKYQQVLDMFHQQYPWITVKHVGNKTPQNIQQAISSGTSPDVALEAGPDDSAKYCSSGAWVDLNPFIKADKINITSVVPPAALRYTRYQGKQCSLPALSDAYGLYYNTKMFQDAGIASPPKTYSELVADAKKLTVYNSDGSIKVAGFVPLNNFYESAQLANGVWDGAQWYDSSGKSAFASDPKWAQLFEWQKSFIDGYGYDKLTKFYAQLGGPNSEWNAQQAFMKGKIAMALDGEWRTAFIKDFNSNVPYATAPFPVPDDRASDYGLGQIGGDIIGIPRGAPNSAEAWLLVKYLALDTQAEVKLATLLGNVPTTFESLKDPAVTADPNFAPFLDIFANPNSGYKQITPLGTTDTTLQGAFLSKYYAGNVSDLQAGLEQLASQIDKQSQLG
jgi:multiple sugar transport system substrate-binding protein